MTELLNAAARAFALVAMADARQAPAEAARFTRFVEQESALSGAGACADAFQTACTQAAAAPSFEAFLPGVAAGIDTPQERALLLRAGRAALVADGVAAPQESAALRALAQSLGLDPETA
jgi:tellurite resistance protein